MKFEQILGEFTAAVEAGDGKRLAALFAEDGVYRDTFYGEFTGREAIRAMLEDRFHRDAEAFRWEMREPVFAGTVGYAWWVFSYTSKMRHNAGKRVAFQGFGYFRIVDGRIAAYHEAFNTAAVLAGLGVPGEKIAAVGKRWIEEQARSESVSSHLRA
jgi:ketosteroid isomerase-like protein